MGECRVHTVPIVPLGLGGESEYELAQRPKRYLPGTQRGAKMAARISQSADNHNSTGDHDGCAAALRLLFMWQRIHRKGLFRDWLVRLSLS